MATHAPAPHSLVLRSLILVGLVGLGLYLVAVEGLLGSALQSDRSYISWVILLVYGAASGHWLWLSHQMSGERNRLAELEAHAGDGSALCLAEAGVRFGDAVWTGGYLARHLRGVLLKKTADQHPDISVLSNTLGDEIANRHAAGHFVSDTLLKLGLLGTMVGFILMLMPVADLQDFDPQFARQLLRDMSGGMAVALYTTLAGIITSTLLKLQYQILDTSAQDFLNRLTVLTDVYLLRPSAPVDDA